MAGDVMAIFGRKKELRILENIYSSKKAEFLAIYGRRRVGKTYLIRHFFEGKRGIFFSVMGSKDGSYKDQIEHFTQRIGEAFLSGITPKSNNNWEDAFKLLTDAMNRVPKNKKIVIFLDELPWLATRKSKLLQILDYYWNQYWSMDGRIKLVVCGSSASWIINKIINNKGGLHNRVTETIYLQAFSLCETEEYLLHNKINLSKKQLTEIYMVTGGVAFYLSKIPSGLSSTHIIEKLAFQENALLLTEFDNLFSSLFDDSESYIEMIKAIAENRSGIGQEDLFKKLSKTAKGNTGMVRLKALEDAGFIISFTPHFHKQRGIYYRVIDEYTLFYLYWILPLKETKMHRALEKGYWKVLSQTPKWFSWSGYAFEAVCYKHINKIRRALSLSPTAIPNAWRYVPKKGNSEVGAQIDLLFDRDDDSITICEIKYTDKPFIITKEYAENLKRKIEIFKKFTRTTKQIFLVMISSGGIKKNNYSDELVSDVVMLEDLFIDFNV